MKYFESNSDFTGVKVNTPVDLVRYIVTIIFLSPIRMCLEISRKILFVGEYLNKFLINCIVLNGIMLGISLLYSFFISKRVNIKGGLLPLPSQIISMVILVFLFFLSEKNPLKMNFTGEEDESSFNKLKEIYGVDSMETDSKEDILESSNAKIDNPSYVDLEEMEIIDYDNINSEIHKMAEEIPGIITEESRSKLDKLATELKRDIKFSPPSVNVVSLYSSIKDKEKECADTMFKMFRDDPVIVNENDFVEDIKKNRRDFEELLGPKMTEEDLKKAMEDEVEAEVSITEGQEQFYRAYEQMNPVQAMENPEIHMKYEDSFNMNIKAGSSSENPEFHKYSNKDWEVPVSEKEDSSAKKEAEEILEVYNSVKDFDAEIEDPVFNFNDLLDMEGYI